MPYLWEGIVKSAVSLGGAESIHRAQDADLVGQSVTEPDLKRSEQTMRRTARKGPRMKAGHIKFLLARDRVSDSPKLRIEVKDDDGVDIGEIELVADDLTSAEDRHTVELFACSVDEARRKAYYIEQFDGNRERVLSEMQDDLYEWSFRQRRDKERWEGLGDAAVNTARKHR
jgi:hypothetical protein